MARPKPALTSSSDTQEPILALRRQLAMVSGAEGEAGQCWLQHAKLCRVSGHFEAATTASLEALARQVPGAGLERAKLLWDMDKPHRAIISLQEVHMLRLHDCDSSPAVQGITTIATWAGTCQAAVGHGQAPHELSSSGLQICACCIALHDCGQ